MFRNDNGLVKLKKPFPQKMTLKKAKSLSIEKHEFTLSEVLSGNKVLTCGTNTTCALCYKYDLLEIGEAACRKCPIGKITGLPYCNGSPYNKIDYHKPETIQAEIDFLKSL